MTLDLRRKLQLLLLTAVSLSVLLVGGALTWYSQRLHEEEAGKRFAAARNVVVTLLQRMEASTRAEAAALASRQDLIASLNLISRYQSAKDYQPLVFDPEKNRIALELAQAVNSQRGFISERIAAVYDSDGNLVSFAVTDNGTLRPGFVSFDQGRRVVRPADGLAARGETAARPLLILDRFAGELEAPAGIRYLLRGDILFVQASVPIERTAGDGVNRLVGRVVVGGLLDSGFVDNVSREAGVAVALAPPGGERITVAGHTLSLAAFGSLPKWHRLDTSAKPMDTGALLVEGYTLPLAGGQLPALLLLAEDKEPLLAQMSQTRSVVLVVLLVTSVVLIPLGAYAGKRAISDPVRLLVRRVEAIRRGEYGNSTHPEDSRADELGWLARNISAMAATIRQREQDLRDSQVSLNEAQRVAQLGNWDWDSTDGRLHCSEQVHRILGVELETLPDDYRFVLPHVIADDRERVTNLLETAVQEGIGYQAGYRLLQADGTAQEVFEQVRVTDAPSGNRRLFGTLQVVTELRRVENTLRKTNRSLRTLSAANEALVHASDDQQLMDEVCRILVEVGNYRMAWIGIADRGPDKRVRPIARAGRRTEYLDEVRITWDDSAEGQGPTGKAIRTGTPQVLQDIHHDQQYAPWRAAATQREYASSIAFPLKDATGATFGALNVYSSEPFAFGEEQVRLLRELAGDLAYGLNILRVRRAHDELERARVHDLERLQRSMQGTIQALSSTIEIRDPYTAGHQRRVAELAAAIARELGMSGDQVHGIFLAGVVHDIGKINIPAEILSKPSRLSDIEFTLIKTHPKAGYEILKEVEFPWPIARIVQQHHERLDGSGYPHGLKGDEILPEARILTVADVVEAMASDRPYRPGLGVDPALEEIQKHSGVFYDPDVVNACVRVFREKGFAFS